MKGGDDDIIEEATVKAAFKEMIAEKKRTAEKGEVKTDFGTFMKTSRQEQMGEVSEDQVDAAKLEHTAKVELSVARPEMATAASGQEEEKEEGEEEIMNHFKDFPKDFLLDVQHTLESFGVDIGDLGSVANFD